MSGKSFPVAGLFGVLEVGHHTSLAQIHMQVGTTVELTPGIDVGNESPRNQVILS